MGIIFWILLGAFVGFAAVAGAIYLLGNIRVLDNGKLIRSAQLSEKRFKKLLDKHGIMTVINLRGTDDAPHEKTICEERKITYFGPEWSSHNAPTPEQLRKMITILELAENPVYIHCLGGSDRSGIVSAIYKLMKGESKKKALKMLTVWYFHFSFKRPDLRKFVKAWKGVEWAKNEYDGKV